MSDTVSRLLELARTRFGELSKVDTCFFQTVAKGGRTCYRDKEPEKNDPATADSWGADRVLKANRIEWLCTDPAGSSLVTPRGICIKGLRVDGEVDLQLASIPFPLFFERSALPDGMNLRSAEIKHVEFIGTHTGPIEADGLKVQGDLFLRNGFKAKGGVSLMAAQIGGDLDCANALFINAERFALTADGMKVSGSICLSKGFKSLGGVRLVGAKIGGTLDCQGADLNNPRDKALHAERIEVGGGVFLSNGFKARGEVNLLAARVGEQLNCDTGRFEYPTGHALCCEQIVTKGNVFLRHGFKAQGEVTFNLGQIGGDLSCVKGAFINREGVALNVNTCEIRGSVFLRDGFEAEGSVRLCGAKIGGRLTCTNGRFSGGTKHKPAIDADAAHVAGHVFMTRGFQARGEVRLYAASIGGNIECDGGQFINPSNTAIEAQGVQVRGQVFLRSGFHPQGKVNFTAASIDGCFQWTGVESPGQTSLDLRFAHLGFLDDDPQSWPKGGNLYLHALTYDEIHEKAPSDSKSRLQWLRSQPPGSFSPQPYEQLASVLTKHGRHAEAEKILIAKNDDLARLGSLGFGEKQVHGFLKCTVEYGYRPFKVVLWALLIILFGFHVFAYSSRTGAITPARVTPFTSDKGHSAVEVSSLYPKFNAAVFSVDTFVPLIDMQQATYWTLNANFAKGTWFRYYLCFHILAGWVLTAIFLAALTALIRRRK